MIKINLLGDTVDREAFVSRLWMYIAVLGGISLLFAVFSFNVGSAVDALSSELARIEAQRATLRPYTAEVREMELKKRELIEKTALLATLRDKRRGPVRVLDDLNRAVPEQLWLTEIREAAGVMRISGVALDNPTIAACMKSLESSAYFSQVDLVSSRQTVRQGVKVHEFSIEARVLYGGEPLSGSAPQERES